MTDHKAFVFRFGDFEVSEGEFLLIKAGEPLPVEPKAFRVLLFLLQNPGRLVKKDEILSAVWNDCSVSDNSLTRSIATLRRLLGDDSREPRYIATVQTVGYRLLCPVEVSGGELSHPEIASTHLASDQYPKLGPMKGFRRLMLLLHNPSSAMRGDRGKSPRSVESLDHPSSEPLAAPFQSSRIHVPRKVAVAVALAGCFVVTILLYLRFAPRHGESSRLEELQLLTTVPITTLTGVVWSPTFSPDGSQVAFAWDGESEGKGYDLYVKVIGADKPLRLTHHPSPGMSAAWSPDGSNIALLRTGGDEESGLYLIPPTGGPERKLATPGSASRFGNGVNWSPDGKRLVFSGQSLEPDSAQHLLADAPLQLDVLSLDTLESTKVETGCIWVSNPMFSPRGTFLSWVCNRGGISSSLWLLRLNGGKPTQLLTWDDGISGAAWSGDELRMVFSSLENDGAIWEIQIDHPSHLLRLPVGHGASYLAANPSRPGLAYVQGTNNVNIWRLDLQSPGPQSRSVVKSTRGQRAPSISRDGKRIAFESDRNGAREVWVCDADGSSAQQLSRFGQATTGTPRWSPDGKLIAFDSRVGGESNIYTIDHRGGVPRRLKIDVRGNSLASWSQDGQWIYFVNGEDAGTPTVWKVPSSGGHAIRIADRGAFFPIESPDGQHVFFVRNRKLWQVKADGSAEQQVVGMPDLNSMGDEWFPHKSGIYFLGHEGKKGTIKRFDLSTKVARTIFELPNPTPTWIGGMPVSPDGSYLLYPQVDARSSDLMLIENWR